jgi:hypothetical protein
MAMGPPRFENIRYDKEISTGIVTVAINRPEIKNALTLMVLLELDQAVDTVAADESAAALVITGAAPKQGRIRPGKPSAAAVISTRRRSRPWTRIPAGRSISATWPRKSWA